MTKKNCTLVTGISGLLGYGVVRAFFHQGQVVGTYHHHPVGFPGIEAVPLDLTLPEDIRSLVHDTKPNIVIHCAASTDVDYCQDHPAEAHAVNVEGTATLAREAAQVGALMVYISTDSVFDGSRGMYSETDPVQPVNVYSGSKVAAEDAVRRSGGAHLILRTNFFGWSSGPKKSLAEWMLRLLQDSKRLPAFSDVTFSPLFVDDLGPLIADACNKGLRGLYHLAARDACTKLAFAHMLARQAELDFRLIMPTRSMDRQQRAPRPSNTSLRVEKISAALGKEMPTVQEGITRFLAFESRRIRRAPFGASVETGLP